MISRRTFVSASVAASAATWLGTKDASETTAVEPPRADAELRIYFVGGTAFVNEETHYTALQMSGYGMTYEGRDLEHASFVVGPKALFPMEQDLEENNLHPDLADYSKFKKKCLVGHDVLVTSTDGDRIKYKCKKVAHFKHITNGWKRKEPWTPGVHKPVNSRFALIGGELYDGTAVNIKGAAVEWWVKEKGTKKPLSDVTIFKIDASTITISGLNSSTISLRSGEKLSLYVFAGPLHPHDEKYKKLVHAYLLTSIYDVGQTQVADILPTTESDVDPMKHKPVTNPCAQKVIVPPDSDFCVNYDELP